MTSKDWKLDEWDFAYCPICFKQILDALKCNNKMSFDMSICSTFYHKGFAQSGEVHKLRVRAIVSRQMKVWKLTNSSRRAIITDIETCMLKTVTKK
jgi:hypothetical protein